eukprot:4881518-Alexandrium_andersonii.AAC.1
MAEGSWVRVGMCGGMMSFAWVCMGSSCLSFWSWSCLGSSLKLPSRCARLDGGVRLSGGRASRRLGVRVGCSAGSAVPRVSRLPRRDRLLRSGGGCWSPR